MSDFCTVINCMDGRVQYPVNNYLIAKYGIKFVDVITRTGPDKILSDANDEDQLKNLHRMMDISVKIHGSSIIAICGHHDCAGNPVSKEEHFEHVKNSVNYVKGKYPDCEVFGIWIGEDWEVSEI